MDYVHKGFSPVFYISLSIVYTSNCKSYLESSECSASKISRMHGQFNRCHTQEYLRALLEIKWQQDIRKEDMEYVQKNFHLNFILDFQSLITMFANHILSAQNVPLLKFPEFMDD